MWDRAWGAPPCHCHICVRGPLTPEWEWGRKEAYTLERETNREEGALLGYAVCTPLPLAQPRVRSIGHLAMTPPRCVGGSATTDMSRGA